MQKRTKRTDKRQSQKHEPKQAGKTGIYEEINMLQTSAQLMAKTVGSVGGKSLCQVLEVHVLGQGQEASDSEEDELLTRESNSD